MRENCGTSQFSCINKSSSTLIYVIASTLKYLHRLQKSVLSLKGQNKHNLDYIIFHEIHFDKNNIGKHTQYLFQYFF